MVLGTLYANYYYVSFYVTVFECDVLVLWGMQINLKRMDATLKKLIDLRLV